MIRQYRPLLGAAIALLATGVVAGELTLYEGENFQGRNLTLRSDMRDLDRTQFNDRAMSLVIRDGVWEVCSDAQFRGHCATLQPGNYPVLEGGLDRRISSVRQVAGAPVVGRGSPPGYAATPVICTVSRGRDLAKSMVLCALSLVSPGAPIIKQP